MVGFENRIRLGIIGLVLGGLVLPRPAAALPSFAEQTGQPCAACHVGAFGPQLKPFGRDFKLYGYVASDGKRHFPPISNTLQASFTNTKAGQPGGAAPGFAANNNFALDQGSLYYAGRISETVGAFVEAKYDGVAARLAPGAVDIRHTTQTELFEQDLLVGFTTNNQPSVSDAWNSTPAWGFPYNQSPLAPAPGASAVIDGRTAQQVQGIGTYALWNDLIYAELAAYQPLGKDVRNGLGILPYYGSDRVAGAFPYWRVAVQQDLGRHFLQAGTFGLDASLWPSGDTSAGRPDHYTDIGFDANWQWIANPKSVVSDMVSAHATWIHETATLGASRLLSGTNGGNRLDEIRADVSYSFAATWTPTIQLFRSSGTPDPTFWGGTANRPDSSGVIVELAYVPFGKPDSFTDRFNMRVAAQYVAYFAFNGTGQRASANNALYLSVWSALRF